MLARAGRAFAEALHTAPESDAHTLRQQSGRQLTRVVAADGMVRWAGWLDGEAGALLSAAIDPLAAPRPARDGTPDPRSAGRRRADALLELTRLAVALAACPKPAGCDHR